MRISDQVHSKSIDTDAFQEVDNISMFTPVTKWCTQVSKSEDIPSVIEKAFEIARSGRKGPVLIDITKDVQASFFHCLHLKHQTVSDDQDLSLISLNCLKFKFALNKRYSQWFARGTQYLMLD